MSLPDHEVWRELETYFRMQISIRERRKILDIVRMAISENPDIDLNELTLRATEAVLKKASKASSPTR